MVPSLGQRIYPFSQVLHGGELAVAQDVVHVLSWLMVVGVGGTSVGLVVGEVTHMRPSGQRTKLKL